MEDISIKHIIGLVVFMPIICAELWFACALGRIYEDHVRCENGATQFCMEEK